MFQGKILTQIAVLYFNSFPRTSSKCLQSFEHCLKLLRIFYLKYKAVLDPRYVPTSELEIFVTKAIFAKCFISDDGSGPEYISDSCYHILRNPSETKKYREDQQNLFSTRIFLKMLTMKKSC